MYCSTQSTPDTVFPKLSESSPMQLSFPSLFLLCLSVSRSYYPYFSTGLFFVIAFFSFFALSPQIPHLKIIYTVLTFLARKSSCPSYSLVRNQQRRVAGPNLPLSRSAAFFFFFSHFHGCTRLLLFLLPFMLIRWDAI